MVVVACQPPSCTTKPAAVVQAKGPITSDADSSKDGTLQRYRPTLSQDKILVLRVTTPSFADDREPQGVPRPVVSMEDLTRKRDPQELPVRPLKKARLIVLASRRAVHFEPQDSAAATTGTTIAVKTHVRIFDRVEESDIANIWWSGEEMLEIMNREKSAVSVMSFCCDHYTSEVLNLMKMARDHSSKPGMATTESASPLWVASSPARGLERDIVKGFKQRKRQVIRRVLESQRVLKTGRHHVTGEQAPPDLQCQLLSTQYKKWSHPMVRFAQVLAEGDAQVVIDNATAQEAY